MPRLSTLAKNLTAETAFTVLALARKLKALGKDVVELEIGDSPFPSTPHAKAAGIRAIEENQTGYCPSLGLPRLRAAAAAFVASEFGYRCKPREHRGGLRSEAVRAVFRRGLARSRRWCAGLQPPVPNVHPQPPAAAGACRAGAIEIRARVSAPGRGRQTLSGHRPEAARDLPQLTSQPDRRRGHPRRPGGNRRPGAGHRCDDLFRRALLPHGLDWSARVDSGGARDARAHGRGLYLQQVL